jgi:hypothetical protein
MPTFYRIVKTDPPQVADFTSREARGLPPQGRPQVHRLNSGISVFDSLEEARRTGARFPWLGEFIATLLVEDDDPVNWEKTLGPAHFTVWAAPTVLLARVVSVERR